MKNIAFCSFPECAALAENADAADPLCATHSRKKRKQEYELIKQKLPVKPIRKVSVKEAARLAKYNKERVPWLRGKMCAVYPHLPATTVHHMEGRIGYADEWARENDVPRLLDKRTWKPASLEGHMWIENNPEKAKELGFSRDRLNY